MEEASFNPKDFQPQYEHSSPIPITNICEIESEAQFHTPDLKATQVRLDDLLCVETLSHSTYDIFQSECSGENAMPIYDRKISSDMHDGMYFTVCIYVTTYSAFTFLLLHAFTYTVQI